MATFWYNLYICTNCCGKVFCDHSCSCFLCQKLTRGGEVVHIDFGFILTNSPGGNLNFESSPFKLTQEFVEVMDGEGSEAFNYFKLLFIRGFTELRKWANKILLLVSIMQYGSASALQTCLSLQTCLFIHRTRPCCSRCY